MPDVENDTELLFQVIGDIARSEGMTQLARELNLFPEKACTALFQGSETRRLPQWLSRLTSLDTHARVPGTFFT
jgi:hypothetical protein